MNFKDYIEQGWSNDGLSAKCLHGIYINYPTKHHYPHDPDDLCRVLQMLRLVPEIRRKGLLLDCAQFYESKQWLALYNNWNQLMDIFSKEWDNNSAPETYEFMERIYGEEIEKK